jgi:hypothetical protein
MTLILVPVSKLSVTLQIVIFVNTILTIVLNVLIHFTSILLMPLAWMIHLVPPPVIPKIVTLAKEILVNLNQDNILLLVLAPPLTP